MSEPIRILCVFSLLSRGGAENMCMNLYRNINREQVQFDFVKHSSQIGAFEKEILELGGRIYECPRYTLYNHFNYIKWWENHFKNHPEHQIVHGHYYTTSAIYFKVAKRFNRYTIAHSHNTRTDSKIKEFLQRNIEEYADFCYACSTAAGKWLFPHKSFTVLHNAINVKQFAYNHEIRKKIRKTLNVENKFVLGTVANFTYAKNPFGLIEIVKTIVDDNKDTVLLWVGDGPLRKSIEEKIESIGLDDKIKLLGVRDDVAEILQAMDCFLLPSIYEGLPVALIEAQAAGLPCICSDAITKEVDVTELCHFVPIQDIQSWIRNTQDVDTTKRKDQSEALCKAGYSIGQTARELEEFYLKVYKDNYTY